MSSCRKTFHLHCVQGCKVDPGRPGRVSFCSCLSRTATGSLPACWPGSLPACWPACGVQRRSAKHGSIRLFQVWWAAAERPAHPAPCLFQTVGSCGALPIRCWATSRRLAAPLSTTTALPGPGKCWQELACKAGGSVALAACCRLPAATAASSCMRVGGPSKAGPEPLVVPCRLPGLPPPALPCPAGRRSWITCAAARWLARSGCRG